MIRERFLRAALTSAALSVLFLVVYGACNQLTALRPDVGTIAFSWERHLPFVPWLIVPYMSIDLFFVAAPFFCATDSERRRFAWRIILAILVAGIYFTLFPLRFAFERPSTDGALGALFDWFRTMDLPYNLAPSLHIALRTILAEHYHRHTRGLLRAGSHVWFFLIGLSTVLVWQHHVIDVVAGFILGGFCLLAFPDCSKAAGVVPNRRVGAYYGFTAVLCLAVGWLLRPWGVLSIWPVLTFAVVAAAYFRTGAGVFQKSEGRIPPAVRLALAPLFLGQWLSLHYYGRRCRALDEIAPGVWIGRVLNDREAGDAVMRGVTAVLDLTGEFNEAGPFLGTRYRNLAILDLTAPTQDQLREMSQFIAAEAARGIVYVHCKIGYSRSAAAVGAWLLASGRARDAESAIACLRRARPSIIVRPEISAALTQFAFGLSR